MEPLLSSWCELQRPGWGPCCFNVGKQAGASNLCTGRQRFKGVETVGNAGLISVRPAVQVLEGLLHYPCVCTCLKTPDQSGPTISINGNNVSGSRFHHDPVLSWGIRGEYKGSCHAALQFTITPSHQKCQLCLHSFYAFLGMFWYVLCLVAWYENLPVFARSGGSWGKHVF